MAPIGDAKSFENGRQLAAWLGLVPRQHSTGGKQTLLGISKRADKYLRTLLVHGARAVLAGRGYPASPPRLTSRQGYHLLHWTDSAMTFWAISDLNPDELEQFQRLLPPEDTANANPVSTPLPK